jgi:hypothetical protein
MFDTRSCRVCGCTDDRACLHDDGQPCGWAEDDICTVCAEAGTCDLPSHTDDIAVQTFAEAMKAKMTLSRDKGRSGWETMPQEELWTALAMHIAKGDPVDVANFAMMIWAQQNPAKIGPTGRLVAEVDGVTHWPDGTIIYRVRFEGQSPVYPASFSWEAGVTYAHVTAGGGWSDDDLFSTEADFLKSVADGPVEPGWTRLIARLPARSGT